MGRLGCRADHQVTATTDFATTDFAAMAAEAERIFKRVKMDQARDAVLIRLGIAIGDERGYQRGERDECGRWEWALGIAKRHSLMVTHAVLTRRRNEDPTEPCPTRCGRCSRCVRAHAWQASGGRDYPGDGGR